MDAWFFVFDIFIGFIGLFFSWTIAPGVSFGSFIISIIIICLLFRIFLLKR